MRNPFSLKQMINNARRLLVDPSPQTSGTGLTISQAPGTGMGDAPVTVSLSQLDDLRALIKLGQKTILRLERELAEARTLDPAGRIASLHDLAREMLIIVRFAIANLPPSEIPRWPFRAVMRVAELLPGLPDFGEDDKVLKSELTMFANEIKEYEADRARKHQALLESAPDVVPTRRMRSHPSRSEHLPPAPTTKAASTWPVPPTQAELDSLVQASAIFDGEEKTQPGGVVEEEKD